MSSSTLSQKLPEDSLPTEADAQALSSAFAGPEQTPLDAKLDANASLDTAQPSFNSREVVLRVKDLGKCYHIYTNPADRLKQALLRIAGKKFYKEFWALRGLSLEVRKGEAVGILGRNGSGKSTLLQMIAGTLTPTTGSVEVAGRVAALLELGSGFNPQFTGRENVYLNGAILGFTPQQIDERFDAIASFADIGDFLDQPVKTYSSGMMVRLAFAVQVQVEPDILIIDEALAVGDAIFQKRCYQRLRKLRESGLTLLFVSHSEESVRTLTDRAIVLERGNVRAMGPSAQAILEYRKIQHEQEARWFGSHIKQAQAPAKSTSPSHQSKQTPAALEAKPAVNTPQSKPNADPNNHFGDQDAFITKVQVLDQASKPASYFTSGDLITIRVQFRAQRQVDKLNVALRIRSKQGVKICSWGTFNQDRDALEVNPNAPHIFWHRTFKQGDTCTVLFKFNCPLGSDLYEVQAAIMREEDLSYRNQRVLHWIDEAAFFQVAVPQGKGFFGGLTNLHIKAEVTQ